MAYNERGHAGDLDSNRAAPGAGAPGGGSEGQPVAGRDPSSADHDQTPTESASGGGLSDENRSGRARSASSDSTWDSSDWWDDPYRRRRRLSLFARIRSWFGGRRGSEARPAAQLAEIAREAYELHTGYANQATAHVAARLGYPELGGKSANEQVAYMREKWSEVDARAAQDLANLGELVVAGRERPGGTGHTGVVTPGQGAAQPDGTFYPNVTAGGPASSRSDGTKTAADVWPARDWRNVRYYKPR